ncbi:hypothetical protein AMTR_s00126p00094960 [Amborella trichopoda]|uniref:Patatin n=1 Tax=Amborella trichopoda TaxID=13333 RepID=W1NPV3_AMBTC|nr:hypothetical protein AMTR_s00126p00094960 [Amborella trichopoda]
MEEEKEWRRITYEIFSKLEENWLKSHLCRTPSCKQTRILSIDGGSLKALTAAKALVHLESCIQMATQNPSARIPDFFDLIAGTGLGGLLAAMLLSPDHATGRPMYSAKEAIKCVVESSGNIFQRRGLFRRTFSGKSCDRTLARLLSFNGEPLKLSETLRPLLIPCYDLNSRAPFVFSRASARGSSSLDFELWRVCRATGAMPGMFKPVEVTSVDRKTSCVAVDGGLVMNSPAAAAVTHVLHNKGEFPGVRGVGDVVVLSIGAGPMMAPAVGARREVGGRWGGGCSPAVVEAVLDGVSDSVDQILGNAFWGHRQNYVRIQASSLPNEFESRMDGWSSKKVKAMVEAGERMLSERSTESLPFGSKKLKSQTNAESLDAFARKIVAIAKSPPPSLSPYMRSLIYQ